MLKIATRQDIVDFEQQAIPALSTSVYEVIAGSVAKYPERTALRFFLQGNHYQNHVAYTYLELMGKINAAANMFRDLGIGDKSVVTYILPNLPETLFTVYGAETAGIVNAVNPMLDPEHIIDIMNAAGSKILVTLAPSPNTDLWEKALKIIPEVASLETVLTVSLGHYVGQPAQVPTLNGDMPVLDFMEWRGSKRICSSNHKYAFTRQFFIL